MFYHGGGLLSCPLMPTDSGAYEYDHVGINDYYWETRAAYGITGAGWVNGLQNMYIASNDDVPGTRVRYSPSPISWGIDSDGKFYAVRGGETVCEP